LEWETAYQLSPTLATEPANSETKSIDGLLSDAEYANSVLLALPDSSGASKINTEVRVVRTDTGGVALGFEIADDLGEWFRSAGQMTLWVSSSEFGDPTKPDCSGVKFLPGVHSRKFELTWTGDGAPIVVQSIGQCDPTNPWKVVSSAEAWAFDAALHTDTDDTDIAGALVEIGIEPVRPTTIEANAPLAVMFQVFGDVPSFGVTPIAEYPLRVQTPLSELEVPSWGKIWLGPTDYEPLPVLPM
jgi:hypothetical protein